MRSGFVMFQAMNGKWKWEYRSKRGRVLGRSTRSYATAATCRRALIEMMDAARKQIIV